MLELFDKNGNYWLKFEDCEWNNDGKTEYTLCVELKGTTQLKEDEQIPEETQFMMSVKDARYLHQWLDAFLKNCL